MFFKKPKKETSIRSVIKRMEEFNASQSLYEYIAENCVEGELPRNFSLPKETEKGKIQFADGAMDGIAMYHGMGVEMPDEEVRREIEAIIHLISEGRMTVADRALDDFAKEHHTPLSVIDYWQKYVIENREKLNAANLYRYSVDKLLHSSKVNEVKYGMITLELFTLQDEKIKDAVRTLGLSDEFTLFSIFVMQKWENGNDEIFRLAKHVHGWGLVHAVDRLEASTQEISDWLLHEGVKNSILPEYSALTCFEKADVPGRLKRTLSHEDFADIGNILVSMLSEGPCAGISAVGDEVLGTYLEQVNSQSLDASDYQRILAIFHYGVENDNHVLRERCEELLHSEECRELVVQELQRGEGLELAVLLGVEYQKLLYDYMERQFDESYHKVSYLMREEAYVDRAIELFVSKLPLSQMQTGPADEMGLGMEYADYRKLITIVQELKDKPGKGELLLQTAVQAPVINNRNMALSVLESWVQITGKPLKETSPMLYGTLLEVKNREVVEKVRERMEKLTGDSSTN